MKRHSVLAALLAASTIVAGTAYAADQSTAADGQAAQTAPKESPAQKKADQDFVKFSSDGAAAFRDVHLARLAIFNADPNTAKSLVEKAQGVLSKAKNDATVFDKAEADLKQPEGMPKARPSTASQSGSGASNAGEDASKSITWLPVDAQLTLGEDFVATPQKAAAVADANTSLAKGDQKGAAQKLKLAGIEVNMTMAVLPLDRTIANIDQAAQLLKQDKYYEANAALKKAEDGLRFDVVDVATPVPGAKNGTAKGSDASGNSTSSTSQPKSGQQNPN